MPRDLAGLLSVVVIMISLACQATGNREMPQPAVIVVTPDASGGFTRELVAAQSRYAQGIECGTQYLFEMADLANEAPEHLPELVAAFRTGVGAEHASVIVMLMRRRANLVIPSLVELSRDQDPAVRRRALEALETAVAAVETRDDGCTPAAS